MKTGLSLDQILKHLNSNSFWTLKMEKVYVFSTGGYKLSPTNEVFDELV